MKNASSSEQVAAFVRLTHPFIPTPSRTHCSASLICCNHSNRNAPVSRRAVLVKFARTILSVPTAGAILHAATTNPDVVAADTTTQFCPFVEHNATTSIDPATDGDLLITDTVDIYIRAGDAALEKITLGLFGCVVPRTVENFKRLITQGAYNNTSIYRIVPSLTVQMGDILNNGGASGPESVIMEAENYAVLHTIPGIVSMVRNRDGTIDSRFFVATRAGDSQYLDGKYSAFGVVTQGLEKLTSLERFAGRANIPKIPIAIEKAVVADTGVRINLNDGNKMSEGIGTPIILRSGAKLT